jgi:uncharacterized protein (TIGR02145 family)
VNGKVLYLDVDNTPVTGYIQGICPSGWHVPSDVEWSDLEKTIALDANKQYSTDGVTTWLDTYPTRTNAVGPHGAKMKSTTMSGTSNAYDAENSTKRGFGGLLPGAVAVGSATSSGSYGYFWSSSSYSSTGAWARYLYTAAAVGRANGSKGSLFSVRCKKN